MIDISDVFLGQIERGERSLSRKILAKVVYFTGCSSDFILFGDESPNSKISKINKILNRCSDDVLDYIYGLIRNTLSFVKKYKNRLYFYKKTAFLFVKLEYALYLHAYF